MWSCSDAGSGVVTDSVSQTVSAEGEDQSAAGTCEDHAGNIVLSTEGANFFRTKVISCETLGGSATVDDVEIYSTGGTSLRFDALGDQFIQNWQTPRSSGTCYVATVGFDDRSSISAYFKTK